MTPLVRQLAKYAAYHRDPRNILTHFVGIPLIVFSVFILLHRASFEFAGVSLTAGWGVFVVSTLYYLRLSPVYGAVMALAHGALAASALQFAQGSLQVWLVSGVGLFVVGWIIQFLGHHYEGRKPAFTDDLMGLVIGPLFVVAEAGFLLGLGRSIEKEIVRVTGPVARRDMVVGQNPQ